MSELKIKINETDTTEGLLELAESSGTKFDQADALAFALRSNALSISTFALTCFKHHMLDKESGDYIPMSVFHKQMFTDIEDIYYERVPERYLINVAPRGHAKSTDGSLILPMWAALHGFAKFIVIVSDTNTQAKLFADTIRGELEANDTLKGLYGDMMGDKWSEGDFVLKNGCRIVAKGSGQKVRGLKHGNYRPDLFILDDLENNENVKTREQRRKLEEWFVAEVMPSVSKGGVIAYHGTIIHHESLLAKVYGLNVAGTHKENEYKGWVKRYYQAHGPQYDTQGEDEFAPMWPEMYDREYWIKLKDEYQKSGLIHLYYREYMNEAVSPTDLVFRPEYFKYFEEKDIKNKTLRKYMLVDSAPSGSKIADYNVVLVIGWDTAGNGYVLDYWRARAQASVLIDKIFEMFAEWTPRKIGVQKVGFELMLKQWLEVEMKKRGVPLPLIPIKTMKKDSVVEAGDSLEPFYKMGFIYHRPWMKELEEELLMYPQLKHDDTIECMVMSLELRKLPASGNRVKKLKEKKSGSRVKY